MPAWALGEELKMPGTPHRPAPVPTLEKIIGKDSKPTTDFVRYLMDVPNAGFEGTGGKVPVGTIVMYGGLVEDIPPGWEMCDGNNDTPNLIDRFILGTVTEAEIGQTGGYAAPQMPAHVHTQTSHTHTITHTHSMATHSHPVTHTHTINDHNHTIDHDHGDQASSDYFVSYVKTQYNTDIEFGTLHTEDDAGDWSSYIFTGNGLDHGLQDGIGIAINGDKVNTNLPNYTGSSGNKSLTTNNSSISDTSTGGTPNTDAASTPDTGGATAANTGSTGAGDETLGNYPPYYKLIYIMRMI